MSAWRSFTGGAGLSGCGDDRRQNRSTGKLIREGIPVVINHDAKNVHGAGPCGHTAAIAPDNFERMECERLGIPQMERAELLGQISEHWFAMRHRFGTDRRAILIMARSTDRRRQEVRAMPRARRFLSQLLTLHRAGAQHRREDHLVL